MISKKLTEIAKMCQGTLINAQNDPVITGVYINTREHNQEQLFIPIIGDQFDGHKYVQQAFEQGAIASLFNNDHDFSSYDQPLILVDDTRLALGKLAQAYRQQMTTKVIGITGSNGKTSAKDILRGLTDPYFQVGSTVGNRNNDIGLPLTILESEESTNLLILEMGMSALGEISYLQGIAHADIALITSIGSAHLNDLGSMDNIIKAKLEITENLSSEGTLIVNGDDERFMEILSRYQLSQRIITYGFKETNDYVIASTHQFLDNLVFHCEKLTSEPIVVPLLGQHQALNTLGAILAAKELNIPIDTLLVRLKDITVTGRRNELSQIGEALIIDDSYKSNPEALKEGLILLSNYPSDGRKIAVLGDMLDLGPDEVDFHQDISKLIDQLHIDRVYTIGNLAKHFHDYHSKISQHFETSDELIESLKIWLNQPSVLLFKAAHALRLFDVVEQLKQIEKEEVSPMKKVAVIFGGKSSEYSVSLSSAASVLANFPTETYECIKVGMSRDGHFFTGDYTIKEIENDTWMSNPTSQEVLVKPGDDSSFFFVKTLEKLPVDVAFNMIHGKYGEDGVLQSLLKSGGIKYTGCDQESSILCYDKDITHRLLDNEGILKARYRTLKNTISEDEYYDLVDYLGHKVILKPSREGSSYGISVATNYSEFNEALLTALKFDNKVVVEEFIEGFEVGAAVLQRGSSLIVGQVDEIELQTDFFDYEGKYEFKNARIVCPARIDDTAAKKVKETAKLIFNLLDCRDFARVDFFYGKDNRVYFNEINTIPGFTSHSRFPSMMKAIGIEYKEIISTLIENGLNRS